jgi:branched-chain amino acid transport system ATP-binding protein
MSAPLLAVRGLVKRYGALVVTDHASLEVAEGEVHGIIGPNGAGKTTLIAQLAGELRSDAGRTEFAGADISALPVVRRCRLGIARSYQVTSLFGEFPAIQNVAFAIQAQEAHSFRFWREAAADPALREPAQALLETVGLGARAATAVSALSHGERRALEIALVLATRPRLLLLDEPMAGMGSEEAWNMTRLLEGLKGQVTMVLVEHDMDAVFALSDRITALVAGRTVLTGTPDQIRADPRVREAYLGEDGI